MSAHFAETDGGQFFGTLTEKAKAFADGDDRKLAAAAFIRFMAERELEYEWDAAEPSQVKLDGWEVTIQPVRGQRDRFIPGLTGTTVFVQLELELAVILGFAIGQHDRLHHELLRPREWLSFFPQFWPKEAAA